MLFGFLGLIVAVSFVLLVIAYATSDQRQMSLAVSLGSAIFLFVTSALFLMSSNNIIGLVLLAFGTYALYSYTKARKAFEKPLDEETEVQRTVPFGEMSEEEARLILEVRPNATAEDIQDAYKRMMMEFHPDRKGNTYMASKINEARDVLLRDH